MMCALLLRPEREHKRGRFFRASENVFNRALALYETTLTRVLLHPFITLIVLICLLVLNVYLFYVLPKGLFPEQDTGRLNGSVLADQATSFQALQPRLQQMLKIVKADPGVANVVGFTGGGGGTSTNTARMFISLKPLSERKVDGTTIINRLRPKLARIPGATLFLQLSQDLRFGGRASQAEYQYTLQGENYPEISEWAPKLLAALQKIPVLTDANSDQQNKGMQSMVTYDRDTAARFGITSQLLDNTLYDAFGQRPVSVMYTALNQYQVIMEAAPAYGQNPEGLKDIYVLSSSGDEVPLSALAHYATTTAPLTINHQGQFPCVTLSFNLAPGKSLSDAVAAINQASQQIGLPSDILGSFQGTAALFQQSLQNEKWIGAAAILAVYIVLGILYESFIHPITILTTLPSATVGAAFALLITGTSLTLIAAIGIILLIGIVKKNAIMMIDFALNAERHEGKSSRDAIFEACRLRFRPIMMTTLAAMFGAVPLAFDFGTGGELRRPLGITIIGGLLVSQMLTLFTTPVVYLYWDRAQRARAVAPTPSAAGHALPQELPA
jgi:multidrug efflux pump